jgi:hypothetical protein
MFLEFLLKTKSRSDSLRSYMADVLVIGLNHTSSGFIPHRKWIDWYSELYFSLLQAWLTYLGS